MSDRSPLRQVLLPLTGLLAVAAAFGLWWGMQSVPPGETEIINRVAADYVAETSGALTDCYARPSALEDVRMVVICEASDRAAWVRAVGRYGNAVEVSLDALEMEPQA